MAELRKGTVITSGNVRLNYVHVFEPYSMDGDAEKYSACLLIPKDDKRTLDAIRKAFEDIYEDASEKFTVKGKKVDFDKVLLPMHDGDEERPDNEAFEGMYFINVKSNKEPKLFTESKTPIDKGRDDLIYSGLYANVGVSFYPYNFRGKCGIGASFFAIWRNHDGDVLGSNYNVADLIDEVEDLPF